MKSKISFFNKTIFQKNVTLYWPIWALYTVFLLIFQPIMLWSSCYYSQFYNEYTYGDRLEDLIEVLYLDYHVYFIALAALCIGMALFHYMYNHKSANMIHALPVDRKQLFGTNVVSGLLFLAVPQTISALLTVIVALCNGIKEVHYVAYWLGLVFGTDIVAMAVVTFCAMFTGHILALPVYAIILNYFSYWVYYIIYIIVSIFGFGVNGFGNKEQQIVALFSPTKAFSWNIGLCPDWNSVTGECEGVLVYGLEVLAVYLIVAVLFYVVAYVTYQKRHVEQAGEFITVGWVKPIARFGVAITGGFYGGLLVREFLRSIGIGCNVTGFVFIILILGVIAYFVADMFIHKSFHVFKKKNWIGCGICSVAILLTFFGLYGVAKSYENYQPKLAEVKRATICMGYEIELEGEEVETILALHKEVLENIDICIREEERGNFDYEYVTFDFTLKNGDTVSRGYPLPYGYEKIDAIFEKISVMEQDVDNYLEYVFVKNYEDIEVFNGGWFEAQFADKVHTTENGEIESYGFDSKEFTSEQAKEMYEAIIADIKAGTLMKYNVYSQWVREGNHTDSWHYSEANVYIEYQNPNDNHDTQLTIEEYSMTYPGGSVEIYEDAENWYGAHITFGPDCENIVNKLIEFGFMESVDDLWWGEQPE